RTVAEEIVAVGHVRVVWLGIRGTAAQDGNGVVVAGLLAGGPAADAGLRDNDVIRRVDGRPVSSMANLRMVLRRRHPGERVMVVYERANKRRSAADTPTERPAQSRSAAPAQAADEAGGRDGSRDDVHGQAQARRRTRERDRLLATQPAVWRDVVGTVEARPTRQFDGIGHVVEMEQLQRRIVASGADATRQTERARQPALLAFGDR